MTVKAIRLTVIAAQPDAKNGKIGGILFDCVPKPCYN